MDTENRTEQAQVGTGKVWGGHTPFSVHETSLSAPASPAYGAALLLLGFEKSLQVPLFPQPEKGRREENFSL